MYENISLEDIMMNDSLGLRLGVPVVKEIATGTIGGSPTANTNFKVVGPIYPLENRIIPTKDDVTAYLRKATGSPAVDVDTEATVASISGTEEDAEDDTTIYDTVVLSSAPTTETADHVVVSYAEQLEPMVSQDISPTLKQTVKEVERMYSTDKIYGYGSIDIKIKSELVMTPDTITQMRKLMYEAYAGDDAVETGYTAYQMRAKPLSMYGELLMKYEDLLGVIKLNGVKITPDLPQGKQGDFSKLTTELSVPTKPILIVPDA